GNNGETPLLRAAQHANNIPAMQELISAGGNIHAVDIYGYNAVTLAAWKHQFENVRWLVELGVNACLVNEDNETAIDMARSNRTEDSGKGAVISFLQEKCGV